MRAEDTEKEEGGQEQEIEVVTDSETEQQASDKEETEVSIGTEKETVEEDAQGDQSDKAGARGGLNWEKLMELMSSIKEDNRLTNEKTNENLRKINEEIKENKENSKLMNESLIQINERFDRNNESISCLLYTSRCV